MSTYVLFFPGLLSDVAKQMSRTVATGLEVFKNDRRNIRLVRSEALGGTRLPSCGLKEVARGTPKGGKRPVLPQTVPA